MNILLIGSGGREDALCWRLSQSPSCERLVAAPGNPGMARWADALRAVDANDPDAVVALAKDVEADLVVIGPEAPLVAGVADALEAEGIACFGPSAKAAQLEGSKGFTKDLCARHDIPTAAYVRTEKMDEAIAALDRFSIPVVVKADGLAAGKGVTVAASREEAEAAIRAAGDGPLVIEEFLSGEEASLFALVDGKTTRFLASAQDYKQVGEGDVGPNTGGMGACSPAYVLTDDLKARAMEEIVQRTADAMADEGMPFRGVLYAGLMLTKDGPKLIEYNVRFGDPECEAIMLRIGGDFAAMLHAVATGGLADLEEQPLVDVETMTVIIAAKGYPGKPVSGGEIKGIEAAEAVGAIVFHAGTALDGDTLRATGGRVLAVTTASEHLRSAREWVYRGVEQIEFADGFYRSDIGLRDVERQV